jgi:hypothetical protein
MANASRGATPGPSPKLPLQVLPKAKDYSGVATFIRTGHRPEPGCVSLFADLRQKRVFPALSGFRAKGSHLRGSLFRNAAIAGLFRQHTNSRLPIRRKSLTV